MALFNGVEVQSMAVSASLATATFEGGIQRIHVVSTVDCYVNFDEPATTGSFLIKANTAYNPFDFGFGNVKKIFVITAGGTGTFYMTGMRGNSS